MVPSGCGCRRVAARHSSVIFTAVCATDCLCGGHTLQTGKVESLQKSYSRRESGTWWSTAIGSLDVSYVELAEIRGPHCDCGLLSHEARSRSLHPTAAMAGFDDDDDDDEDGGDARLAGEGWRVQVVETRSKTDGGVGAGRKSSRVESSRESGGVAVSESRQGEAAIKAQVICEPGSGGQWYSAGGW